MAVNSFRKQFKRLLRPWQNQGTEGFTLIELLVVMLIASGIVSGLLYLVVELQQTDQRESSRSETQREMQLALDYISGELREAVYVYEGECLTGRGSRTDEDFCPGIVNYIPANLTAANQSIPVLAFWKQQRLPSVVRQACADGSAEPGTPCLAGSSYALIVYSLSTANPNNIWDGNARITRYALTQFDSTGARNPSWTNPGINQRFQQWPLDAEGNNLQATRPGNTGIEVLVDFVDDGTGAIADNVPLWNNVGQACPGTDEYNLSLDEDSLTGAFANAKTFYACVSDTPIIQNRDTIVYLRGNARGRPGVGGNNTFLPTLETRVLSRVVLGKSPGASE